MMNDGLTIEALNGVSLGQTWSDSIKPLPHTALQVQGDIYGVRLVRLDRTRHMPGNVNEAASEGFPGWGRQNIVGGGAKWHRYRPAIHEVLSANKAWAFSSASVVISLLRDPAAPLGIRSRLRGFDGAAFNPKTRNLIIYDNKSFAGAGNVGSASAIDPKRNLAPNLEGLIARVLSIPGLPSRMEVLDLLRRTHMAIQSKASWPPNVAIAVSNAGGRSTGVTPRLAALGIKFIDYYQAPQPKWQSGLRNHDVAAAIASGLGAIAQWLGDIGIEREIRRRLQNELAPSVRTILARGHGVLVVLALQEWETENFQGRRARGLLDVYIEGGTTQQEARRAWESTPHLLKGAPNGWRVVTQYGWIPPLR